MSRLYNAFLLFGETKNPSELVQETKEHLKPFTQTKQLILSRDTIKGNNNLFCLHDRQALCLELFTSRILFRQTDTQASLQKKKSGSIELTRVDRFEYKVSGTLIQKHEIKFECLSFPKKEWIKMRDRVFVSQSSEITTTPRGKRILRSLVISDLTQPLFQGPNRESSSYYPSATGKSNPSTEAEESIPIIGLLMLFINDEIQTLTITHYKDRISLYTSKTKPKHNYLVMWFSKSCEQYIIGSGIQSGLSVRIGREIKDDNLKATPSFGNIEDERHYIYSSDSTNRPISTFTDIMLDFSSDWFTFPESAVKLWLQACGIIMLVSNEAITSLVKSECEHSFTFRDGKGEDVFELPLSLMRVSNVVIRLGFSKHGQTFTLGRPLLDLYDFSIHRIERISRSKILQRLNSMSGKQHELRGYFEKKQ